MDRRVKWGLFFLFVLCPLWAILEIATGIDTTLAMGWSSGFGWGLLVASIGKRDDRVS